MADTYDASAAQGSSLITRTTVEFERQHSRLSFRQCRTPEVHGANDENGCDSEWSSRILHSESLGCSLPPTQIRGPSNSSVSVRSNGAANFKPASPFTATPQAQRNSSLPLNFENATRPTQYLTRSPGSEGYEEHDASVAFTQEEQDETLYGPYAETDLDNLDEITDFSQKYNEHVDNRQNFNKPKMKDSGNLKSFQYRVEEESSTAFSQDTVKVYCTEGTPITVSSASSLTDLRDVTELGSIHKPRRRSSREPREAQIEESEPGSYGESPSNTERNLMPAEKEQHCTPPTRETKMVSFVDEVNFAEETPLMFSRSSSLGSLSSFDQQGTNDDHGSMTGNYSQQTSGNISPSDLPDSPSQSMPSSPRDAPCRPVFRLPPCVYPLPPPVDSVFKEVPQSFAEEVTPCGISQATSLSSLTIDDAPCIRDAPCISEVDIKSEGVFGDVKHKFAEEGTPFQISRAESLSPLPMSDVCDNEEENGEEVIKYGVHRRNESPKLSGTLNQEDNYFSPQKYQNAVGGCNATYYALPQHQEKREYVYQNIARNVVPDKKSVPNHVVASNAAGVASHKITKVHINASSHNEDFGDDDIFGDAKREFMEEGTPYQYSRRTSLSSLSFDDESVTSAPRGQVSSTVAHTTAWQSELPNSDIGQPHTNPDRAFSVNYASKPTPPGSSTFADETKVYCTEDTPASVSHAASLNDLAGVNGGRVVQECKPWTRSIDQDKSSAGFDELGTQLCDAAGGSGLSEKPADVQSFCEQSPSKKNQQKANSSICPSAVNEGTRRLQNMQSLCTEKTMLTSGHDADSVLGLHGSMGSEARFVFGKKFGSDGNIRYEDVHSGRELVGSRQSRSAAYLVGSDVSCFQVTHTGTEQSHKPCITKAHNDSNKILSDKNSGDPFYNAQKPALQQQSYSSDKVGDASDADNSAVQDGSVRRGMSQSSNPATFPRNRYTSTKLDKRDQAPHAESDDEADDRRILEELIRLGKQQLKAPPPVPSGRGQVEHTSRTRTKERPAFSPGSPSSFHVPQSCDKQVQRQPEYNRARFTVERSEPTRKVQKQSLIHSEQRSCSERRQKPVTVLQRDAGYTSACDMPELYQRNQSRFREGGYGSYEDFASRKPENVAMQCYASPMISRQLPNNKSPFRQLGKTSACEANKTTMSLTGFPQSLPPRKMPVPKTSHSPEILHSDPEDEEMDLKCLRELILKGSAGLSDTLPEIPSIKERAKVPNHPAISPTITDSPQQKVTTGGKPDALQAMVQLSISCPTEANTVPMPSRSFLDCSTQTEGLDCIQVSTGTATTVSQPGTEPKICKDSAAETDSVTHSIFHDRHPSPAKPVDFSPNVPFAVESQCDRSDAPKQLSAAKPQRRKPSPSPHHGEKSRVSPFTERHEGQEIRACSPESNVREIKQYDMPPEPPADSLERVTAIRIKLPNGRSLTRRFLATWELRVLLTFLESLGYPKDKIKILKNWRRQELSTSNPAQTLEQLKLYPKKTLTIKER